MNQMTPTRATAPDAAWTVRPSQGAPRIQTRTGRSRATTSA